MAFINKYKKILFIFFILVSISVTVSAASDITNGIGISKRYMSTTEDLGNTILGIVKTIAIFFSVGILMLMGIKYMFGSIEEKAEFKKTFIRYIIGAILVFGITEIVSIIYKIMKTIS